MCMVGLLFILYVYIFSISHGEWDTHRESNDNKIMPRGGELHLVGRGGGNGTHGRTALSSTVVVCEEEEEEEGRGRTAQIDDRVGRGGRVEEKEQGEGGQQEEGSSHQSTVTLRMVHPHRPHAVRWTDDTIDNEHMGKKKSKKCCIYHKPRQFGDWSDTDSEGDNDHCHHCHDHE